MPERRPTVVELQDAAVVRAGHQLWSGLQATIRAGDFVAVLGPNGVGKSTLLQVILGRLELAVGEIRVRAPSRRASDLSVGYLPQRRSFGAGLHIRGRDVVGLGLDGHRWGTPIPFGARHRARRACVDEVIELVGATSYADRPIGHISGGEQQRLLIAQALVSDPALLLLDEPLDSLDLPSQSSVAALLGTVCAERGIAVVLVAHDVNPLLPYLDLVIYLARGASASGPPQHIITSETLSRLYRSPVEVLHTSDGRLVVIGQPAAPDHRDQPRATPADR